MDGIKHTTIITIIKIANIFFIFSPSNQISSIELYLYLN